MRSFSTPLTFRKALSYIVIFSGLLYVLLTSWANLWIGLHQEDFVQAMRETADRPISVEKVQFRLPNRLILKGVTFEPLSPLEESPAAIQKVEARFWITLLPRPALQLRDLSLDSPRFNLQGHLNDLADLGTLLSFPKPSLYYYHGLPIKTELFSLRFRNGEVILKTETGEKTQRLSRVSVEIFKKSLFRPERFSIQAQLADDPKARFRLRGFAYRRGSAKPRFAFDFECQRLATAFLKPYLDKQLILPPEELTASIKIGLEERGVFHSHGKILFQRFLSKEEGIGGRLYKLTGPRILYRLKGQVGSERFTLHEVSLRSGKLKFSGKGKGFLKRGYSSYELSLTSAKIPLHHFKPLVPELSLESGTAWVSLTLAGKREGFVPQLILNVEDGSFRYAPLYLNFTKVGGTVRLSQEGLAFSELWAFVNNLPIRLSGELLQPGRRNAHPAVLVEANRLLGHATLPRGLALRDAARDAHEARDL